MRLQTIMKNGTTKNRNKSTDKVTKTFCLFLRKPVSDQIKIAFIKIKLARYKRSISTKIFNNF